LKKILKFKRKKREELLRFRDVIDYFHRELTHAESRSELKQICVRYKEKIEVEVQNLRKTFKLEKIKIRLGSFKTLIKSPAFLTAVGSIITQDIYPELSQVLKIGSVVSGVKGVIDFGYYLVNERIAISKLKENPFVYLLLCTKREDYNTILIFI